jgi:hypothetical protein
MGEDHFLKSALQLTPALPRSAARLKQSVARVRAIREVWQKMWGMGSRRVRVNEADGIMPACGHSLPLSPTGKCQPLPVVLKLLLVCSQIARLLHPFGHTHLRRHDQHAVFLLKRLTILAFNR